VADSPGTSTRRLREAHAHLVSLGQALALPSVEGCGCVRECLEVVRREVAVSGGGWVRVKGARVAGWAEGRWPTLAELDGATGAVPVVVMSFDHHEAVGNSAALRAACLSAGQQVGVNGVVEADCRTGEATGLLREEAAYAAWGVGGAAAEAEEGARRGWVEAALGHLARLGYVEAHDLHSQAWLPGVLAAMEREGALGMKVWVYPPAAGLEEMARDRGAWESERVRLAGGKVFADGTLNGRTALMLHRYAEPLLGHPRGQAMVSPMALDEAYRRAGVLGLPLAVHAIGDGAVRMVLDSIERVFGKRGDAGVTAGGIGRQRIEHAEVVDGADVPRFAGLGVVCSVQPSHLLADVEALRRFVPHRLERVLPLRELVDSGCVPGRGGLMWMGSDVPIVRAEAEDCVRAAVWRRREGAAEEEAIGLGQALTEAEAWAGLGARGW